MFEVRKNEDFSFENLIITSFNQLFEFLQNNPLNSLKDLVNQNTILKICMELDENLFKDCIFIGENSAGILYSELKELFNRIIEYLKKAKLNFNSEFKEIERLNFTQLINYNQNEINLFAEFILLFACNCQNRDRIIDKISNFSDQDCNEILKIIEKFINVDDTRESINNTKTIRNSVNNFDNIENENPQRTDSKFEFMEKELEKIEAEKRTMKSKLNNLEIDLENSEKEIKKLKKNSLGIEERNKKLEKENIEIKKINQELDLQIKRFDQINKDNSVSEKYKVKLDEKEFQLEIAIAKLKESENKCITDKKNYDENIDKLNNTIISLMEYKDQYENISEKLKENKADNEKLKDLENVYKDYKSLNKKYCIIQKENENLINEKNNLDLMLKDLEEKLEKNTKNLESFKENQNVKEEKNNENKSLSQSESEFIKVKKEEIKVEKISLKKEREKENDLINENKAFMNTIKQKEFELNEVNSIVRILEEKQNYLNQQNEDLFSEKKLLEKTIDLKADTIKEQNDNISTLNKKLELFQDEIFLLSDKLNMEIKRKADDIENCKKENDENKNRYEKEFELIASSLYNLGLNYWSMKISSANELNEKPSWLKKERKKYYDGDL